MTLSDERRPSRWAWRNGRGKIFIERRVLSKFCCCDLLVGWKLKIFLAARFRRSTLTAFGSFEEMMLVMMLEKSVKDGFDTVPFSKSISSFIPMSLSLASAKSSLRDSCWSLLEFVTMLFSPSRSFVRFSLAELLSWLVRD